MRNFRKAVSMAVLFALMLTIFLPVGTFADTTSNPATFGFAESPPYAAPSGKAWVNENLKWYLMPADANGHPIGSVYDSYIKPSANAQTNGFAGIQPASIDAGPGLEYYPDGPNPNSVVSLGDIPHLLTWVNSSTYSGTRIHGVVWAGDPYLLNNTPGGGSMYGYEHIGYCSDWGLLGTNNSGQTVTVMQNNPDNPTDPWDQIPKPLPGYGVVVQNPNILTPRELVAMEIMKQGFPNPNITDGWVAQYGEQAGETIAYEVTQYALWAYLENSKTDGTYTGGNARNMWKQGIDADGYAGANGTDLSNAMLDQMNGMIDYAVNNPYQIPTITVDVQPTVSEESTFDPVANCYVNTYKVTTNSSDGLIPLDYKLDIPGWANVENGNPVWDGYISFQDTADNPLDVRAHMLYPSDNYIGADLPTNGANPITFKVYINKDWAEQNLTGTTNDDGSVTYNLDVEAMICNVAPSDYVAVRGKYPDGSLQGYVMTVTPWAANSAPISLTDLTFKPQCHIIAKKIDNSGNPLAGAKIKFTDTVTNISWTGTTGVDGTVEWTPAESSGCNAEDNVDIVEIAPPSNPPPGGGSWQMDTTVYHAALLDISVTGDAAIAVTIVNTPTGTPTPTPSSGKAGLEIEKLDSITNQRVGGAVFQVKGMSLNNSQYVFTITASAEATPPYSSDPNVTFQISDGYIKIDGLPASGSTYQISEISPPPFYTISGLNSQAVTLYDGQTVSAKATFKDQAYGSLRIRKVDAVTNAPLGGVSLKVTNPATGFTYTGTTNNSGYLIGPGGSDTFTNLAANSTYLITEVATLPNYILSDAVVTAVVLPGQTANATFTNVPKGSTSFYKKDAVTGGGIPGAVLEVRNLSTNQTWSITTGPDGVAFINSLPPGSYSVFEKLCPEGWEISNQVYTFTVVMNEDTGVTIVDQPWGSTTVVKEDSVTSAKLSGANIKLTSLATGQTWDVVTGYDGTATVKVPSGAYAWQEQNPVPFYTLNSQVYNVVVVPGQDSAVKILNEPWGSTTVIKEDSVSSVRIPNTDIKLTSLETGQTWDVTTSASGTATVRVPPGAYAWQEQNPAPFYSLNPQIYNVKVLPGQDSAVKILDDYCGTATVIKEDAVTSAKLPGANIRLTNPATGQTWDVTTGNNGTATVTIPAGTYFWKEQNSPPSYDLNPDTFPVTVIAGEDSSTVIEDTPFGSATVIKEDALTGAVLGNANFSLTDPSTGQTWDVTTGSDGTATVNDLPGNKTYIWRELNAPLNYELDSSEHSTTVLPGKNSTIKVENNPLGSLLITKINSLDPTQTLAGVMLRVQCVSLGFDNTYTTSSNGEILINGLYPADYQISEIATIPHFILSDQIVTATVQYGKTTTVCYPNSPKPYIDIYKIDSQTNAPLENVVFSVTNKDTQQNYTVTSAADGHAIVYDVSPGWFDIRETSGLPAYVPNDAVFQVYVDIGAPGEITIKNTKMPSLTILKKDKDSLAPLAGGVFSVEMLSQSGTQAIPGSPFTTDSSGKIFIPAVSPSVLKITEQQAPYGYNIDDPNYQIVTMTAGEDNTVAFLDTRQPSFILTKSDSQLGTKIVGASFSIEKLDNPNMGMLTGNPFVTNSSGKIIIPMMQSGSYRVTELQDNGYAMPTPNTWDVYVTSNQDYNLNVTNTRLPSLVINKLNGLSGKGIPGATFEIYYAVNGSQYGDMRDLGSYVTNSAGQIVIPNCPMGWYRYVETRPAQGFSLPSNPVNYVFLSAGDNAYSGVGADAWVASNGSSTATSVMTTAATLSISSASPSPSPSTMATPTPTNTPAPAVMPAPSAATTPAPSAEPLPNPTAPPSPTPTPMPYYPPGSGSGLVPTEPNIPNLRGSK